MSSVSKAMTLLNHFSEARPEIGLSQLCRMAGRDKATTYRHLQALETIGFIEQNRTTKHYRLGPAFLHFAHVREATVPRKDAANTALRALANVTGETAHVTVLSGTTLYGLCACESPHHGMRAVIDINIFPLHATASGLCALAFGPPALFDAATANLTGFTPATPTTADELTSVIERTRATGFACADQSYENEVQGIAAPIFDHTGLLAGAVAVASVASRCTPSLEQTIKAELILAAGDISRNWGGTIPTAIEAAWARSVKLPNVMDATA
ncbi:MAG: IclR family transcriptional regulator [Pseudomonadota bacterium]